MRYEDEVRRAERDAQKRGGWIGVDLDGTLFRYDHWVVFGEPIEPMIRRVRDWLAEGTQVRIVTARVGVAVRLKSGDLITNFRKENRCRVTGEDFSDADMVGAIWAHLARYELPRLRVQSHKDADMIELWDDRAVQVVPNTGRTLAEEHEAELSALRGKAFQSGRQELCPHGHDQYTRCARCGE